MGAYDIPKCFVCDVEDTLGEVRGTQSHPINCGWRLTRETKAHKNTLEEIVNLCFPTKLGTPQTSEELKTTIQSIRNLAINSICGRYDIDKGVKR